MKYFEYNCATAEMVKLYLRNSHAQEARKVHADPKVSTGTQDATAMDPVLADNNVGMSCAVDSDSSDSSGDEAH